MASLANKMWLKRVLIPFWLIEIFLLVAYLILTSILYVEVLHFVEDNGYNDIYEAFQEDAVHYWKIGFGVNTGFLSLSLLFDLIAIVLFARDKLAPGAYLAFQCVKLVIWAFCLAIDVIAIAGIHGTGSSGVAFAAVFFLTSLGQLIYGAVIVHRARRGQYSRGAYVPTVGGKTKYYSGYDEAPRSGSYSGYNPHSAMHQNPFRDPSPNPSNRNSLAAPVSHPGYESYRSRSTSAPAPPEAAATEMQQSSQAALHSYEAQGTA